jgi:hypothetical protein
MTTASNSINTDSIDRITSGILTIGGTATSVSLKDTTTQDLTITGRTTSGIETTTITPSYTSIPTQVSNQRALQLYNFCPVKSGNIPYNIPIDNTGVIFTVNTNDTGPVLLTITLPIGVWSITYTLRYRSNSNVALSYAMTTATLATPVTYNGITYPKYLGLQAFPTTLSTSPLTSRCSFSGNTIITNNVAGNVLSLQGALIYPSITLNMGVSGAEGSGAGTIINTFMIATRIA